MIAVLYKKMEKTNGSRKSDIKKEEFIDWTNVVWTFMGESWSISFSSSEVFTWHSFPFLDILYLFRLSPTHPLENRLRVALHLPLYFYTTEQYFPIFSGLD